jgi:hypothetical protein
VAESAMTEFGWSDCFYFYNQSGKNLRRAGEALRME